MQTDTSLASAPAPAASHRASPGPLHALAIALALLFPFLAYFGTAASMVQVWDSSGTFAHGYVILPIALWLIWQRRDALKLLPVAPFWPALALLLGCGLLWLLADMGDVQIIRQYAFVAMLPLSALAILGWRMTREMAFPLLFLLFAVPFGEIFINPLINITANFTVDALVATGIPVFREGNNFTIPSGSWSVVEACSGVRYLISSFTLGCLYAYLTYRSAWRRAVFVLLSILVPVLANGARAYMIVIIGHLSGMTLAVGVDHLIYGWVFFGLVMFLLFWLGSFWREDLAAAPGPSAPGAPVAAPLWRGPAAPVRTMVLAAIAIIICVGVWPAYNAYLKRSAANAPAPVLTGLPGLAPAPSFSGWKPSFRGPSAELQQFVTHEGHPVGLSLLYYRNPAPGTKLIGSGNRVAPRIDADWVGLPSTERVERVGARSLQLIETSVSGPTGRILVWHWYWIDGGTTSNDYMGKVLQIKQKLFNGTDDGAAVMVFSPYDERPESARVVLRSFLNSQLDALEAGLAANKQR